MDQPANKKSSKRAIWGWMFYDWASQPFHTLLITFIFAPYFTTFVVGDPVEGQAQWGFMIAAAGAVIALLAPVLGAIADETGPRKPWVWLFSGMLVIGTFPLWWAVPQMPNTFWILFAFAIGFIGVEFSLVFTNAMLPSLAQREEIGKISAQGWGFGYLGGMVLLILFLAFLAEGEGGKTLLGFALPFGLNAEAHEGTRLAGPLTALWYIVFMVPFFLYTPDVVRKVRATGAVRKGLGQLVGTLKSLPSRPSLFAFLGGSMFYRDALNGLYAFGAIYAAGVLGWSTVQIGIFGIIASLSGVIFCFIGGWIDRKIGSRALILATIWGLILTSLISIMITRTSVMGVAVAESSSLPDLVFFACGGMIGAFGGVLQAASRAQLVHLVDDRRMTEAFGLYALSGKATAFIAPLAIAIMTSLTNSQRLGISPVIALFALGLICMFWVRNGQNAEI